MPYLVFFSVLINTKKIVKIVWKGCEEKTKHIPEKDKKRKKDILDKNTKNKTHHK